MIVTRTCQRTDDCYIELCDLTLGYDETRVLIRALEYYTDKRKLDFKERMLSGDMARAIAQCDIEEI